jgi:hypothetical protein
MSGEARLMERGPGFFFDPKPSGLPQRYLVLKSLDDMRYVLGGCRQRWLEALYFPVNARPLRVHPSDSPHAQIPACGLIANDAHAHRFDH